MKRGIVKNSNAFGNRLNAFGIRLNAFAFLPRHPFHQEGHNCVRNTDKSTQKVEARESRSV